MILFYQSMSGEYTQTVDSARVKKDRNVSWLRKQEPTKIFCSHLGFAYIAEVCSSPKTNPQNAQNTKWRATPIWIAEPSQITCCGREGKFRPFAHSCACTLNDRCTHESHYKKMHRCGHYVLRQ